ncbi:CsbD family protein [Humibacter ginsengiterrae]
MGDEDKIENKKDELWGKGKEVVGKATGDDELENQGKFDQTKANLKQAGEKVKDAFSDND